MMAADPKPNPGAETLQRVRRIETRLTQTMIAMGIHTDTQKPIFHGGRLQIPSHHCSLKEIVDSVPPGWHGPISVWSGPDLVIELLQIAAR